MDARFWMGGIEATHLLEIRNDLAALREPGFWAIQGSFEGSWRLARFASITRSNFKDDQGRELEVGEWTSSHDRTAYIQYVERIRDAIAVGTVYQVNACRILSTPISEDASLCNLMSRILVENPAPFASYLRLPDIEIASASPERFISMADGKVVTSPIKGTAKAPAFGDKDRAENLMIVDLMRNDLGQVAEVGSIETPRLLETEAHPGLFHLVSDVTGRLAAGKDVVDLLSALMPPGSVSGAPKTSALEIIRTEEILRGPYCGVIGWYEAGRAEIAVAIRTFWKEGGQLRFGTGAGITWGSVASEEWEETELKRSRLIALASS